MYNMFTRELESARGL